MKTTKVITLFLALTFILSLALTGCSTTSSTGSAAPAATTAATTAAPAATTAATTAAPAATTAATTTDSTSAPTSASAATTSGQPTVINVGYAQNGKPNAYIDDNGNLTGYDIEALKLVNSLLPQYKFNYIGLDQTAVFAGLATGKYQIAATNSFWTQDRADKYLFPSENLGASILGIFTNKAKYADVKTLADAATKKLNLTPILSGDGLYYVVDQYNKANPNNQVKLTATDAPSAGTEAFQWVAEGRYDFAVFPQQYWDILAKDEKGDFHKYYDQLSFHTFGAVKTWSILAKGEDKLAADISGALKQLKAEGKLSELSKKFYAGVDNFSYLPADAK